MTVTTEGKCPFRIPTLAHTRTFCVSSVHTHCYIQLPTPAGHFVPFLPVSSFVLHQANIYLIPVCI